MNFYRKKKQIKNTNIKKYGLERGTWHVSYNKNINESYNTPDSYRDILLNHEAYLLFILDKIPLRVNKTYQFLVS